MTRHAVDYYGDRLTDILPALGTHTPMTLEQIQEMFGDVSPDLFREHDWRSGVVTLGEVPAEYVKEVSGGARGGEADVDRRSAHLRSTRWHSLTLDLPLRGYTEPL